LGHYPDVTALATTAVIQAAVPATRAARPMVRFGAGGVVGSVRVRARPTADGAAQGLRQRQKFESHG